MMALTCVKSDSDYAETCGSDLADANGSYSTIQLSIGCCTIFQDAIMVRLACGCPGPAPDRAAAGVMHGRAMLQLVACMLCILFNQKGFAMCCRRMRLAY